MDATPRKLKVLLIDDSEITTEVARNVLERDGFEVRVANTLGEFNVVLKTWSPNVVLADVNMPGISGIELCQWVKQRVDTQSVPVVLYSDMPEHELEGLAKDSGADGFVSKAEGLGSISKKLGELCEANHMVMQERPSDSSALLLRADVRWPGGHAVTHTVAITTTTVTLACNLPVKTDARVALSFPGLVESFEIGVRVGSIQPSAGFGKPTLAVCTVVEADEDAKTSLAKLAALSQSGTRVPHADGPRPGRRCLLVEDNHFIRELFEYGFHRYSQSRSAELVLTSVGDAEQAWDALMNDSFDVVIIDHFLPSITGAQLIAKMRAEPRLKKTMVVAISVGGPETRDEAMSSGADLFLDKPVVLRDLFSTLDRLNQQA